MWTASKAPSPARSHFLFLVIPRKEFWLLQWTPEYKDQDWLHNSLGTDTILWLWSSPVRWTWRGLPSAWHPSNWSSVQSTTFYLNTHGRKVRPRGWKNWLFPHCSCWVTCVFTGFIGAWSHPGIARGLTVHGGASHLLLGGSRRDNWSWIHWDFLPFEYIHSTKPNNLISNKQEWNCILKWL